MTDEWITEVAAQLGKDAEPLLHQIADEAAERHGAGSIELPHEDAIKIANIINEVQAQTFMLGAVMAFGTIREAAKTPTA